MKTLPHFIGEAPYQQPWERGGAKSPLPPNLLLPQSNGIFWTVMFMAQVPSGQCGELVVVDVALFGLGCACIDHPYPKPSLREHGGIT